MEGLTDNFQEVSFAPEYENKAYQTSAESPPSSPPQLTTSPVTSSSAPASSSSSSSPHSSPSNHALKQPPSGQDAVHYDNRDQTTTITTISSTSNDVKATPTGVVLGSDSSHSTFDSAHQDKSGLNRNRPYSSSVISRTSNLSTRSKVSVSASIHTAESVSAKMFSYKDGSVDKAVETCKTSLLASKNEVFKGAWLLTELNDWNLEFEKVILLTDKTVYNIKYNFIVEKLIHYKTVTLDTIFRLQVADLAFPSKTLMAKRDHGAVRMWFGPPATFLERWDPYTHRSPHLTLTHHPSLYTQAEAETVTYNADDFAQSLITEMTKIAKAKGRDLEVDESAISIDTYASLIAVIHNHNRIGFNLNRNGISI